LDGTDTIWCPTARDTHIQHAEVSRTARYFASTANCKLLFYTVDMESFQVPLPVEVQERKKQALKELFPSQAQLLQNEKYHLFEGYSEKDHTTEVSCYFGDGITVRMKGYNPPGTWDKPKPEEPDETYLNRLIVAYYNRASVSSIAIERNNVRIEFNG